MTKVLVTGATGYIGAELIVQLLRLGFHVVSTVRSESSLKRVKHLKAIAKSLPGKLDLIVVDLLTGSFDEAVKGCKYVHHVASPVLPPNPDQPQETQVDPALKGTRNVLEAVGRAGSVQRVVLTSSVSAIESVASKIPAKSGTYITEEDWCTGATLENDAYSLSKVEAEKLAWQLSKQYGFSLVTINPASVLGTVMAPEDKAYTYSIDVMKTFLHGKDDLCSNDGIVDVQDVAKAHILAAELPTAQGRYILSHEWTRTPEEVCGIMNAAFPGSSFKPVKPMPSRHFCSNAKAAKELGLVLTPPEVFLPAMARCMYQLGHAQPRDKAANIVATNGHVA